MRKGQKGKRSSDKTTVLFEKLESREMFSVVTVQTVAQLPAALASARSGEVIQVQTPGEITGLTFNNVGLQLIGGSGWNVHGNTFENTTSAVNNAGNEGTPLYVNGVSNSHFDHNTFTNVGFGIVAYPGNNCTIDYNTFTNAFEPIHAFGGSPSTPVQNFDVSYNTITEASRHGIEIQMNVDNLTCNYNYMSDFLNPSSQVWSANGLASHMGISAACGQTITAPYVGGGDGMTFIGNTILLNGLPNQNLSVDPVMQSCIELMGSNITLKDNYLSGGVGYLNGAIGSVSSSDNTIVAYQPVANGDSTPWPVDSITLTSADHVYRPGAANVPAAPSLAATVGASAGSTTTPVVSAPTVAAPTNLAANSPSSSEVDLTWADSNSQATYILEREATHGTTGYQTIATLPAGATSYKDTAVTANWEYDYELIAVENGADSVPTTVHIQVEAAPAATTPVVSTPVTTQTTPVVSTPVTSSPTSPTTTTGTTTGSTGDSTGTMIVAAPSSLTATSPDSTTIDLSWGDNTNGTATYVLQRRATRGSTGFQTIATLPAGATSYADTAVNPTWEYNYQLVATVNGVASRPVTVHVQAQPVPAPSGLVVTAANTTQVELSWIDNSDGQATYVLQRRATRGNAGFKTIATLDAGTTSYSDTAVNTGWEYTYRLVAVENGIASTSVTAQAQAIISTPPAPSDFAATSPSSSEVDLSWADNSGGTATYVLERQATHGTAAPQIIATLPASTTSFADTTVNANWEYDYSIIAVLPGSSSTAVGVHVQVQAPSLGQLTAAA
jgi:hypothetical protein